MNTHIFTAFFQNFSIFKIGKGMECNRYVKE